MSGKYVHGVGRVSSAFGDTVRAKPNRLKPCKGGCGVMIDARGGRLYCLPCADEQQRINSRAHYRRMHPKKN